MFDGGDFDNFMDFFVELLCCLVDGFNVCLDKFNDKVDDIEFLVFLDCCVEDCVELFGICC